MDRSSKIVPLGGKHRSAKSLLAEVMNDPNMEKVVLVTLSADGGIGWAHFEMSRAEMAWAGLVLQRLAFDDEPN